MSRTAALIGVSGRIAATMIEADGMLRAFDVTLRNVSIQSIRLRELFIGRPDGAQFAIRWWCGT
jgi:hypothetical protein